MSDITSQKLYGSSVGTASVVAHGLSIVAARARQGEPSALGHFARSGGVDILDAQIQKNRKWQDSCR